VSAHDPQVLTLMQSKALMQYWDQPSTGEWARVLATFSLFAGVSKRRLRRLVRQATVAEIPSGDTVVVKDAPTDSLYLILGGTAEVRGKPAARTLRAGDYFGELGLLGDVPRSATVAATQELHVMRLPRRSFLRLVHHDPEILLTMLSNLGAQFRRLETQAAHS
jgi:CRP/FNR family cyclic AMP-dependent transcriptional regulator